MKKFTSLLHPPSPDLWKPHSGADLSGGQTLTHLYICPTKKGDKWGLKCAKLREISLLIW